MSYYRMMNGLSRGEAVFKYLDIIQSLPMYSMHFFEVKVYTSKDYLKNEYHRAGNFHQEKIFANFATWSYWQKFCSTNFLFCVND